MLDETKQNTNMKRYLLILLVSIPLTLRAQETVTISADNLYAEYDANEVSADGKYKGHQVIVTGTVQKVAKDILGSPYVIISGTDMLAGVQCVFPKNAESRLSGLSKGDKVTISGTVKGKMMRVLMSDCSLQ